MSIEPFKFKDIKLNSPHDNLCIAIGLIQSEILAGETTLDPDVVFGGYRFSRSTLEMAVALLVGIVGEAESLRWDP